MKLAVVLTLLAVTTCSAKAKTGRLFTVMEVDTGIDYSVRSISKHVPDEYKSQEYSDTMRHGTNIAGIILDGVCDNVVLIPCRYTSPGNEGDNKDRFIGCLEKAYDMDVDLVNVSGGGEDPYKDELAAMKKLASKKIIVVAAAGNDGKKISVSNDVDDVEWYYSLCSGDLNTVFTACKKDRHYYYPASYDLPNILRVANYHDGKREPSSNYGDGFIEEDGYLRGDPPMIGTSQATASVTNKILKMICNLDKE
jgi:subtilisin family serine protease